jgi:hypothetical protein
VPPVRAPLVVFLDLEATMIGLPDVVLVCTAWRRPEYLEKTLASWATARGVGRLGGLVVALGPSAVEEQQREIIRLAPVGLDHLTVVLDDSEAARNSPGMHRALGEALTWVRDELKPKAIICAEEDIIVSSDVLEYMGWALNRFETNPLVAAVCAHDVGGQGWDIPGIGQAGFDADPAEVALSDYFNPWVWATWTGRKLDFLLDQWDWDATLGPISWQHGYDWQIRRLIHEQGLLSAVPAASRSQNIGKDGGYYARPDLFDQTRASSFRKHRDPLTYRLIGDHA